LNSRLHGPASQIANDQQFSRRIGHDEHDAGGGELVRMLLAVALQIEAPTLSEDFRAGGLAAGVSALTGAGTALVALAGAVAHAAAALLAGVFAALRIAGWSRNRLLQRRAGVVGDRLQRLVDLDRSGHWDLRDVEGLLLDVFEAGRR